MTVLTRTTPLPVVAVTMGDGAGIGPEVIVRALVDDTALSFCDPVVIGDAKRGEALTYTCRGCHGVVGYKNAYPNYHVPRIGGQQQQYLLRALMEYREGSRKHPTMQAQSESFTEQQIADIAAYLSGFKP